MQTNSLYSDLVLEEARHPHNEGLLPNADVTVTEGVASCGDVAVVGLKVNDKIIEKMTWEATGCAISRAGISLLSAAVEGKPIAQIAQWTIKDVLPLLHLEQISPGRERCLLLGLRALQRALAEYQQKKEFLHE